MNAIDMVDLTDLPRELYVLTGQRSPGYRKLYQLVLDNFLPAQKINGHWRIRKTDLPEIADILRMPAKTAA